MDMKEPNIREKAKEDRTWLEKLGRIVPGFSGYLRKEERRDTDKILREHLAKRLERVRERLDPAMRDLTDQGGFDTLSVVNDLDRVKKALDRLIGRIRYASYGYSGLFDAVKIKEDELDRLYRFDVALIERIQSLEDAIDGLTDPSVSSDERQDRARAAIQACREFDEHLDSREEMLTSGAEEQ
jgi:hypothetical protein